MRRLACTLLCTLSAAPALAIGPEDLYVKESSWAASMTATRQKVAEVELKEIKLTPWQSSDPLPAQSIADRPIVDDQITPSTKGPDGGRVLRHHQRWRDREVIGLNSPAKTVRYLYREVHAGAAGVEEIKLGSDSPTMLWVNDKLVFNHPGGRPCKPGEDSVRVDLAQGKNTIRIKVYSESRGGSIAFEMLAAQFDRDALAESLLRRFWEDFPETDWFLQDNPHRKPGADDFNAQRDFGWYLQPDRDATPEQQMIRQAIGELGDGKAELTARLDALIQAKTSVDDPAWLDLYVQACRERRQERLKALAATAPRFVFTKHYTMGGSHYAYTEGQSDAQAERNFRSGTALCLADCRGGEIRVETLLADPDGVIRDPDVSYDGRRVLFAWKKADRDDDYHLYEMDLSSRSIRPITQGPGVADYEGVYLPCGDILFNSTRCVQTVDCWWTEVSNLYRCDRDGKFLRRLTFDQVHDNYPTVTDDGRILYTRWEYNDRGQVYPQPLLQMNPDGTNQTEFYGVNSWFPTTILHARGVPGTQKALAIATGHHSRQTGKLIVIDPAKGRQENAGVQLVAPVRETPAVKVDAYGQDGELFQYPYPLSETEFLVTYHPMGWRWTTGVGPRFGTYFMTIDGRRELLASDPELPCSQPVPVRPREVRRARPTLVDYRKTDGTCYVQDVYAGPGIAGVARGTVKTLRVVALDFRAAGVGSNGNGGPGGGALVSTPVAIGNGAWDPKIILGDAKVFDDGSVFFRVPARTPIYFQLLDEKGRLVQTMRSWTTIQPGENASCVGCHEHKNSTPLAALPVTKAIRAGAEDLKPFYGPARGFSFRKEIQPILDRKCVRCHNGERDNPFAMTDREVLDQRAKRRWTESYLALTHARPDDQGSQSGWRGNPDDPILNWVSAQSAPPMLPPYSAGSGRSKIIEMLHEGHTKRHETVTLSGEELDKLMAWIDLGVPFCGGYVEANAWSADELEKYQRYFEKRQRLAAEEQANIGVWLQQRLSP